MRTLNMKKTTCTLLSGFMLLTCIACTDRSPEISQKSTPPPEQPLIRSNQNSQTATAADWVPMSRVADTLGLRLEENNSLTQMGFTDVMFQVQPNERRALSFGKQISLPEPPIRQDGAVQISSSALKKLLQTDVRYDRSSGDLHIGPLPNEDDQDTSDHETEPQQSSYNRIGILSISENRSELVSYAKRYLGVPYQFGAKPYEQSKRFDCSSYTSHVFKRFGVSLPRLARDQAKRGTPVKRSNLQVGDLIFFTVPGRFKTDRVPGHVGIYIGGGKFIHTWGKPGVQISPLDTGYWHDMILSMRRVK